jgi:hypothetical protein
MAFLRLTLGPIAHFCPCFPWVQSQFFSDRADVMMISSDLVQRQHLLPE